MNGLPTPRPHELVVESICNVRPSFSLPLPHVITGVLFLIFLFWNDVVQNKLLDKGYDTQLMVFDGLTLHAGTLWYVTLFALFVITIVYVSLDAFHSLTLFVDIAVGALAFSALGIMYTATLLLLDGAKTIPFLGWNIGSITFYHLGIAVQIGMALYFTFTE
jgi:hypothetical protein